MDDVDDNGDNYQQDFDDIDDDNDDDNTLTRNNHATTSEQERLSIKDRIQFRLIETDLDDIDWNNSLAHNNNVNKNCNNRSISIDRNCSRPNKNNHSESIMDYDRLSNTNNIIGDDFGDDENGLNPKSNPNTNNNSNNNNITNVTNIGVDNGGDNGPIFSIIDVPCSKNNLINSSTSVGSDKMRNDHFIIDSNNIITSTIHHHYNDNNRNNPVVEDIDEKMRKAIEKIREANIRKVF